MGMVTDVLWVCPGCGSCQTAQVYGERSDPEHFPSTAVPAGRGLKWNPPCTQCGKFRLIEPQVYVQCVAAPVAQDGGGNG